MFLCSPYKYQCQARQTRQNSGGVADYDYDYDYEMLLLRHKEIQYNMS